MGYDDVITHDRLRVSDSSMAADDAIGIAKASPGTIQVAWM
jgi:hypothetical protein